MKWFCNGFTNEQILNTPYSPVNVDSQRECKCGDDGCTKVSRQYADISVPVELSSKATLGDVSVGCCGEPSVVCRENRCDRTCRITVRQKICVTMPIHYEVDVCMGESDINCYGNMTCCK